MFAGIFWFLGALLFFVISWLVGVENWLTIVLFAVLGGEIVRLIYVLIEAISSPAIEGIRELVWYTPVHILALHPSVLSNGLSIAASFVVHIGFGWGYLGTYLTFFLVNISTLLIVLTVARLFLLSLSSGKDEQQNN